MKQFFVVAFLLFLAPVAQAQLCAPCETVVSFVESWLENNSTVQEIEQYLNQLCLFLPDPYSTIVKEISNII